MVLRVTVRRCCFEGEQSRVPSGIPRVFSCVCKGMVIMKHHSARTGDIIGTFPRPFRTAISTLTSDFNIVMGCQINLFKTLSIHLLSSVGSIAVKNFIKV